MKKLFRSIYLHYIRIRKGLLIADLSDAYDVLNRKNVKLWKENHELRKALDREVETNLYLSQQVEDLEKAAFSSMTADEVDAISDRIMNGMKEIEAS